MDGDDSLNETSWRGCSMREIYRNLSEWELKHAPPIHPSDNHTVLYHWPITNSNEPPKPRKSFSKWDTFHVRLPCSQKSQYPVTQNDGTVGIENRWLMIEKALLKPIKNSHEFEKAVLSYNSKYENFWKFRALHKMFEEELGENEASMFFEDLLPKIIRLALRLPQLVSSSIPLLKQGQNRSISISQQQVACLLANAFLCTFPRRNTTKKKSEYSSFPDINFNRLFQSSGQQVIEKIKCICHYFRRVCNKMPNGVLTFTRRSLSEKELPNWDDCNMSLCMTPLHITSCGTIEDQGQGLLQVDFANKFLGGGVLGSGCVQEEIRFVICPELIVSKLFTEALKPCEALIIIGCEQFSKYTGYASSFTWSGNYDDKKPFDDCVRRQCHIVAIDALYFVQSAHQYKEQLMLRELNKAYVGFIHPLDTPAPGVASGNWGCGAFGGEATLKALIQLMACTITKRPLVYFTFGNRELRDNFYNIYRFFFENKITVAQLWKYLKEFYGRKLPPNDLYSFIIQLHSVHKKSFDDANKLNLNSFVMTSVKTIPSSVKKQQQNNTNIISSGSKNIEKPENLNHNEIAKLIDELSSSTEEIDYSIEIEKQKREMFVKKVSDKLTNQTNQTKQRKTLSPSSFKDVSLIRRKNDINMSVKNEREKRSSSTPEVVVNMKESSSMKHGKNSNSLKSVSTTFNKKSKPSLKNVSMDLKQRSLLDMFDAFYTERPAKRHCYSDKET